MRTLILILMLSSLAFGFNYNDVLLKAQISIFPRILLLDKKIESKLVDGKIVFTVVYEDRDHDTALDIAKKIEESYKGKFEKYEYIINTMKFSDLNNETQATAFYTLNSSNNISKVANIAKEKGVVAFAYDTNNLKEGLLFSLVFEKSTTLYLNKDSLVANKIDFDDSLYRIVRFIDKDNG
ncbi:hypothetical protein [Sulfurimonas sp.]